MIKKIKCLFIGTLVVFSMPALAFAEEEEQSETVTGIDSTASIKNTKSLDTRLNGEPRKVFGSDANEGKTNSKEKKVFLSKLGISIDSHFELGNLAISKLEEVGAETSRAHQIVSELDQLKVKLEQLKLSDNTAEYLEIEFETLKQEANSLSQEFRAIVKDNLDEGQISELRAQANQIKEKNKEAHRLEIEAMVRDIHTANTQRFLDKLGVTDPELIEKIQSGEMKKSELMRSLKTNLDKAPKDKADNMKLQAKEKREQRIKANIAKRGLVDRESRNVGGNPNE
jgi:hypothetical protein